MSSSQRPIQPNTFGTPSGMPAWKTWYLVSSNDHSIDPRSERDMAKRIGATTREVASSHMSPLSHPADVVALIADAARARKQ